MDACVTQAAGKESDGQRWRTGLGRGSGWSPCLEPHSGGLGRGSGAEHLLLQTKGSGFLCQHKKDRVKNIGTAYLNLPVTKCSMCLFTHLGYTVQLTWNSCIELAARLYLSR